MRTLVYVFTCTHECGALSRQALKHGRPVLTSHTAHIQAQSDPIRCSSHDDTCLDAAVLREFLNSLRFCGVVVLSFVFCVCVCFCFGFFFCFVFFYSWFLFL